MPQQTGECREVYPGEIKNQRTLAAAPGWGPGSTAIVALVAALFLVHSYLPLRASDLWQHVTYGNWILDHRALPEEDPVMPLSAGIEVVDGEWLSQVIFALVERAAGPEGLSILFTLAALAAYLVLGRALALRAGSRLVALMATLLALAVGFSRLVTIRPENFGVLAFMTLLWLLVASGADPANKGERTSFPSFLWVGVPVLFALWANLHGSFPAGLIVLGCLLVGRALECSWSTRSLTAVLRDRLFRRWLVLTELAFAGCLINPYGGRLILETLTFSANENLRDIVEWYSLDLSAWGGLEFFLSWALLVIVFRHSRRRVPVADALLIAVFAVMVVRGNRFLSWYAPVLAFVVAPHLAELAARVSPGWWRRLPLMGSLADWQRRYVTRRVWVAATVLLIWAAFAWSPMSRTVLGGRERTAEELLGSQSPIALSEHLRDHPPVGLVFVPQVWSDFLVWAGPEGLQPMVTSMIHLIPNQVWRDYLGAHHSIAGWPRVNDFYSIDTVILDRNEHRPQVGELGRTAGWQLAYEDSQASMFHRVSAARPPSEAEPESESATELTPRGGD